MKRLKSTIACLLAVMMILTYIPQVSWSFAAETEPSQQQEVQTEQTEQSEQPVDQETEKVDEDKEPAQPVIEPEEEEEEEITEMGVTDIENKDLSFAVTWNDNKDEYGYREELFGQKPDEIEDSVKEKFFNEQVKLMISVDGSEPEDISKSEYKDILFADGKVPAFTFDAESELNNYAHWPVKINLPVKYKETVKEKEVTHEVSWTIELPELEKYLIQGKDRTAYTAVSHFDIDLLWLDNGNIYNSRPEITHEDFDVYCYPAGKRDKEVLVEDAEFKTLVDEEGTVHLDVVNVPGYTYEDESIPDGHTIYYFVKLKEDAKHEDGTIKALNNTGYYQVLIENEGDYASESEGVFDGGILELTLENICHYKATKEWFGGTPEDRPQGGLHLYRLAEDDDGLVEESAVRHASPVQHFDAADVPKEDGDIFIGYDEELDELPMYDATGHRYVYFALETGIGGEYKNEIDNRNSVYTEKIENIFDKITTDSGMVKYVLNGGKIKNICEGYVSLNAMKKFQGNAVQELKASVTFNLQQYNNGKWENVPETDKETGEPTGKDITVTMDQFSQESPGQISESVVLPKYDDQGKTIHYRWIETSVILGEDAEPIAVKVKDGTGEGLNDKPEYEEINENVNNATNGPGVNGDMTTLRFEPTQTADNSVLNKLVGDTQIVVEKEWHDASGNNISGTDAVKDKKVVFNIRRDGELLKDEAGKSVTIELTMDDYNKQKDLWEKTLGELPRYDDAGHEYLYDIVEVGQEGYVQTYEAVRSVVKDDKGNYITELFTKCINGPGPGGLEIDVAKEWLDGDDLLTRVPAHVQVYRIGEDGKLTPVEGAKSELYEYNNWYDRIEFQPLKAGDTIDNYVVKETDVNGTEVADTDKSVVDKRVVAEGQSKYDKDRVVGTITPTNKNCSDLTKDNGNTHYSYDVFVTRESQKGKRAEYTVSNLRKGVINLELVKEWRAGGDFPKCTFQLERTDINGKTVRVGNPFDIDKGGLASDGDESDLEIGNRNLAGMALEEGFVAAGKEIFKVMGLGNESVTVKISDLPKYDNEGNQYTYTLKEIAIDGKEVVDEGGNRVAYVEGDRYVSSTFVASKDIKEHRNNHSEDLYKWTALNTKADNIGFEVYKVWRDDGSDKILEARPDIYFDVFRIALNEEEYAANKDRLKEYCDENYEDAEEVKEDKIWDTKHNDWCWSTDLDTMAKYDSEGNRYVYFIKEGYNGDTGKYHIFYSNLTYKEGGSPSDVRPNKSADVNDTTDVYSIPQSKLDVDHDKPKEGDETSVLIIADGSEKSAPGKKVENYYARTVVNVLEGIRTISGEKVWEVPTGWDIAKKDYPSVTLKVARSVKDYYKTKNSLSSNEIAQMVADNKLESVDELVLEKGAEPVSEIVLNGDGEGNYEFAVHDLERYDQYGRTYHYYVYETKGPDIYESYAKKEGVGKFKVENTYIFNVEDVQINVKKKWEDSDIEGITKDKYRPVKINLYAQEVDEDGNKLKDENGNEIAPILMSTGYVKNTDTEITFKYYTGSKSVTDPKFKESDYANRHLPRMGANNVPLVYYVQEKAVNGFEETAADGGTGTSFENPIELKKQDDGIWKGGTETTPGFINKYIGQKTNVDFQKKWSNTQNLDNNASIDISKYRPEGIKFEVWRWWDSDTIEEKSYAGGDEKYQVVLLTSNNDWKTKLENLPKYAPNGKQYTYYAKSEVYCKADGTPYEGAELEKYNKFYGEAQVDRTHDKGSTITNKLKTLRVGYEKSWVNGNTGNTYSASQIKALAEKGMIPDKVTYTLQSRIKDGKGEYEDVKRETGSDKGKSIQKDFDLKNLSQDISAAWYGIPKYDINGNELEYRIKEEFGNVTKYSTDTEKSDEKPIPLKDESTEYNYADKPTVTVTTGEQGTATTAEYKNTLWTEKIHYEKSWYRDDEPGTEVNIETLKKLVKMKMLPDEIKYTLQRKVEGSESEDYTDVKDKNGNVISKTFKISQLSGRISGDWNELQAYFLDGNVVKQYSYRVKEEFGKIVTYSTDDTSDAKFETIEEGMHFSDKSEVSTSGSNNDKLIYKAAFKNTLDMAKLKLQKVWLDDNNFDNTRPNEIKITLKAKGVDQAKGYTYILTPKDRIKKNVWETEIDVMELDENTRKALENPQDMEKFIECDEDLDDSSHYSFDKVDWSVDEAGNWTASAVNSYDDKEMGRKNYSLTATKTFGDKDAPSDEGYEYLRPEIYFTLFYQMKDGTWAKATAEDCVLANDERPEGDTTDYRGKFKATQQVKIDEKSYKSEDVEWVGLYKHWKDPEDDQSPEVVSYKVCETDKNGNIIKGDYPYDIELKEKAEEESEDSLITSVNNKLIYTNVKATKEWNDKGYEYLRHDIDFTIAPSKETAQVVKLPEGYEATKTASEKNNWTVTFDKLPKYYINKDGVTKTAEYVVTEENAADDGFSDETAVDQGNYTITNTPIKAKLSFGKQAYIDENNTETAPLEGAEFKLERKNAEGKYVDYATATSAKDGTVEFSNMVVGEYKIKETFAPDPYKLMDNEYEVTVAEKDNKVVVTDNLPKVDNKATVINEPVKDDIKLIKKTDSEKGHTLEGAEYKLTREGKDGKTVTVATATTDAEGTITFENLLPDTVYTLTETKAPDGYYLSDKDKPATFSLKLNEDKDGLVIDEFDGGDAAELDSESGEFAAVIDWNEEAINVSIAKVTGGEYVEGAELELQDPEAEEGKEAVESWTTDGEAHEVEAALIAGKTYVLHEVSAPAGKYCAEDIEIIIPELKDKDVIEVEMEDPDIHTSIIKLDAKTKQPLAGVTMQIIKKGVLTDEVIDEWETDGEPHDIGNILQSGETYYVHEVTPPAGYERAEDKELIVPMIDNGTQPIEVIMNDPQIKVEITKVDDIGKLVKGAKLELRDPKAEEGNEVVESWTTDGKTHVVEAKLVAGKKYVLHEVSAPAGYELAKDVTVVIPDNAYADGNKECVVTVSMVDPREGTKTGDDTNINLMLLLMMMAFTGAGIVFASRRREN